MHVRDKLAPCTSNRSRLMQYPRKNTPLSKRFTHAKQCSLELSHRTHTLLFLFPALLLTIIAQVAEGTCNSIPATFFGPIERTGPASSLGMALRTNCWQLSSSQGSLQG